MRYEVHCMALAGANTILRSEKRIETSIRVIDTGCSLNPSECMLELMSFNVHEPPGSVIPIGPLMKQSPLDLCQRAISS